MSHLYPCDSSSFALMGCKVACRSKENMRKLQQLQAHIYCWTEPSADVGAEISWAARSCVCLLALTVKQDPCSWCKLVPWTETNTRLKVYEVCKKMKWAHRQQQVHISEQDSLCSETETTNRRRLKWNHSSSWWALIMFLSLSSAGSYEKQSNGRWQVTVSASVGHKQPVGFVLVLNAEQLLMCLLCVCGSAQTC